MRSYPFTRIVSIVPQVHTNHHRQCIDGTGNNRSIPDGIYGHQQSWPGKQIYFYRISWLRTFWISRNQVQSIGVVANDSHFIVGFYSPVQLWLRHTADMHDQIVANNPRDKRANHLFQNTSYSIDYRRQSIGNIRCAIPGPVPIHIHSAQDYLNN